MELSEETFKKKYLLYKSKYAKLKAQLGGRDVKVYSKADSKFQFTVDLDENDDAYSFKNQVIAKSQDKTFGYNAIEIYPYDEKSSRCTGIKKININASDNQLCFAINKALEGTFVVKGPARAGFNLTHEPLKDFEGTITFGDITFSGKIKSGQTDNNTYLTLTDAEGIIKYNNVIYAGTFKNNLPSGYGVQKIQYEEITDGNNGKIIEEITEGNWVDGQLEGWGKIITPTGTQITGLFSGSKLFAGKIVYPSGLVENGFFKDNKLVKGQVIYSTGLIEDGDFVDNKLVKGTVTLSDGSIYSGTFLNNILTKGKVQYADGDTIEGTWINGKLNGKGTTTYKNGGIDKGTFVDGVFVAGTKFDFKLKTVEKGNFVNQLLQGPGSIREISPITSKKDFDEGNFTNTKMSRGIFDSGKLIDGEYDEGDFIGWKLVKGKKIIYPNEEIHSGVFSNGKLQGQGTKTMGNGMVYEGEFVNGELIQGTLTTGNKEIKWEGCFSNGKLVGIGTITFRKGKTLSGEFSNGQIVSGTIIHKSGKEETGKFIAGKLVSGTIKSPTGKETKVELSPSEIAKLAAKEFSNKSESEDLWMFSEDGQRI